MINGLSDVDSFRSRSPVLPLRQLLIDKNLPSPLLTEKIITIEEAVQLFDT